MSQQSLQQLLICLFACVDWLAITPNWFETKTKKIVINAKVTQLYMQIGRFRSIWRLFFYQFIYLFSIWFWQYWEKCHFRIVPVGGCVLYDFVSEFKNDCFFFDGMYNVLHWIFRNVLVSKVFSVSNQCFNRCKESYLKLSWVAADQYSKNTQAYYTFLTLTRDNVMFWHIHTSKHEKLQTKYCGKK